MTVPPARPSNGSERGSSRTPSRSPTSSGSVVIRSATCALPDLARPVPVDLDPVLVGVAEVDRLADEVVGDADDRHLLAGGVREPAGEVGPLRHEQGEVVQARIAARGPRAGLLAEHEQVLAAGPERRPAVAAAVDAQADRALVVGDRAREVGDRQVDGAHARVHRAPPRPRARRRR